MKRPAQRELDSALGMDKVVLVTFRFEELAGGGAVAVVKNLIEGLQHKNIPVVVITTHPNSKLSIERFANLKIYRFLPHNLYWIGEKSDQATWKKMLWQLWDVWNFHAYQIVRRILSMENPSLVHVHKLRGLSPAVWTAARDVGVKTLVQTCHDYELISPEGTLSGQIGTLAIKNSLILQPYIQLRRKFSEAVNAATAPSQFTLNMHVSCGFFINSSKTIVPNSHGLRLNVLNSMREIAVAHSQISNGGKPINVLFLGRLEEIKGVDALCLAFEQVSAHYPDLYLHIAGTGTNEISLRTKYMPHPRMIFHGHVIGEMKSQLMADCDVLIVPSTWPEVFGVVIAEAYAYGKPVIASRIGGIPEIVEEGKTGLLIKPGDLGALSEALRQVAENVVEFRRMAPFCLETARRFSIEAITDEYISVYQVALAKR